MSKEIRDIVRIDEELCDGCGQCVPGCAEGAIEIIDGKARLVADKYCDGLGACLGECPQGAITIIQREAEAFDEEAVEQRQQAIIKSEQARALQNRPLPTLACGCPGTAMATFSPTRSKPDTVAKHDTGKNEADATDMGSALSHWPVKIRLVPPHAPFLKGADVLVAADCAPVAHPGLHQELLPNKVVLIGCPKFDDAQEYVQRFSEIFKQAGVNSVTVLSMEVPCCAGLAEIVRQAMFVAGTHIPFKEIVVTRQGQVMKGRVGESRR